jgi:hypothetical protein
VYPVTSGGDKGGRLNGGGLETRSRRRTDCQQMTVQLHATSCLVHALRDTSAGESCCLFQVIRMVHSDTLRMPKMCCLDWNLGMCWSLVRSFWERADPTETLVKKWNMVLG